MLKLRNLNKYYPPTGGAETTASLIPALKDVSLDIENGEFFTLLGPSGCGKTTTLHCIAGLENPTTGSIEIEKSLVFCSERNALVPPNRRGLGMVFQSYAIWPHMTVFENVAFPLRHGTRRASGAQLRERVMSALDRVKLSDFANRPAPYLSGGQQQRVALARALVSEPSVMLLDEPLSNLDAKLRDTMRVELRDLVKSLGMTTIYVTHDQVEALSMSDRIALMNGGQVVQVGTPADIYLRPKTSFVAEFIGRSNIVPAIVKDHAGAGNCGVVEAPFGNITCELPVGARAGDAVKLIIRPHALEFVRDRPAEDKSNLYGGTISNISFVGEFLDIELDAAGTQLRVFGNPFERFEPGEKVTFQAPPDRCVVLAA